MRLRLVVVVCGLVGLRECERSSCGWQLCGCKGGNQPAMKSAADAYVSVFVALSVSATESIVKVRLSSGFMGRLGF